MSYPLDEVSLRIPPYVIGDMDVAELFCYALVVVKNSCMMGYRWVICEQDMMSIAWKMWGAW